jgi:hypothetical protein
MRTVAIGDPQASLAKFLAILNHNKLLNGDRLKPDIHLISMGDHFDYGPPSMRVEAAQNGIDLLTWLFAHPREQITIIMGNHDLARVCELSMFGDNLEFIAAQRMAVAAYRGGDVDEHVEQQFKNLYPELVDAETLARDFSCFDFRQRELVIQGLHDIRFSLSRVFNGALFVHAGITQTDLKKLNPPAETPVCYAHVLRKLLFDRTDVLLDSLKKNRKAAFDLSPVHVPPSQKTGWGRGVFFHRPGDPASAKRPTDFEGEARARFSPLDLPDFRQVVGHSRDKKCREMMPFWHDGEAAKDGPLRSLSVENKFPKYARGIQSNAKMIFTDGAMFHTPVEEYELLDCDNWCAWNGNK